MGRKQNFHSGILSGASITSMNASALEYPGDLGAYFDYDEHNAGQIVQLDSGATSATPVGVVAATQVAFWKDKRSFIVTNDIRFSSRNAVAGIFKAAVTAGRYCIVQQKGKGVRGSSADTTVLAASGGTYPSANGDLDGIQAIANSGSAADITSVAAGTAPTYKNLGEIRGPRSGGVVPIDLDIDPLE